MKCYRHKDYSFAAWGAKGNFGGIDRLRITEDNRVEAVRCHGSLHGQATPTVWFVEEVIRFYKLGVFVECEDKMKE